MREIPRTPKYVEQVLAAYTEISDELVDICKQLQQPIRVLDEPLELVMKRTIAEMETNPKPFEPVAWYNSLGDRLEVLWKDDSHYGEDLDSGITLFKSFETKEVVGIGVWGIAKKFRGGLLEAMLENLARKKK